MEILENLQEEFRIFEKQISIQGNSFKSLLNQLKEINSRKSKAIKQLTQINDQPYIFTEQNNESLIQKTDLELLKQNQFQNVIEIMIHKISDYTKINDQLKESLYQFNKDNQTAYLENEQSNQLLHQARQNTHLEQDYLQLLQAQYFNKLQQLRNKKDRLQLSIKKTTLEYQEYKDKIIEKEQIIHQQKIIIQQMEQHSQISQIKQQEQKTVNFYANTLILLQDMLMNNDPLQLFNYRFVQRQSIIMQRKEKLSLQSPNIFSTQIEFENEGLQDEHQVTEPDLDIPLMELIQKSENSLLQFHLEQNLVAFSEIVINFYQNLVEQFDKLEIQFRELNLKKYELQNIMKDLKYFKYSDTSNGLIPIRLQDNFNLQQTTLNIMATSVELEINEESMNNKVKQIQHTVIGLFNFLRNHVTRISHLVQHIQHISQLVPEQIIHLGKELSECIQINEIIHTPKTKNISTSQMFEQNKEFQHFKHNKILTQKPMLNTTYVPRKSQIQATLPKFKQIPIIQKFVRSLIQDEVERIFVQQKIIDDLTQEIQKRFEESNLDETQLNQYLDTYKLFFQQNIKKQANIIFKNAFTKLGEIRNLIKNKSLQLRQKGFDITTSKFQSGCAFNNKDQLISGQRTNLISSPQSYDQISQFSNNENNGKDMFKLLKKLTNLNIQLDNKDEDSFDKERMKMKQDNYFLNTQINCRNKVQKNLDDDVFFRLNPKRQNPNKEIRNQLGLLRNMRISAMRSSCSLEPDVNQEIWKMSCKVQPKTQQIFRKIFNSSEKKPIQIQVSKSQAKSFQIQPISTKNQSDDIESVWKKKYRAKKVLNAISMRDNKLELLF